MQDMAYYARARKMPDYGFSPDAQYPLINIEKGGLALRLSKVTGGETGAFIPVYSLYAGIRQNVVPGAALAELGTAGMCFEEMARRVEQIQNAHPRFQLSLTDLGGSGPSWKPPGFRATRPCPTRG